MFDINGKVALISGGVSGLGLMYAKELLRNGLKAVTLADIDEQLGHNVVEDITKEFGPHRVIFVKTDVTNKMQFEEAFKTSITAFNNLDIVINNAGILDDYNWEKEILVNINGCVHGMLLAFDKYLPQYRSTSEAVIVNISSVAGLDAYGCTPIYSTTKHAIIGLSRSYATKLHYELSHIKVLTMCPGTTDTPLIKRLRNHVCIGPEYEIHIPEETGHLMKQSSMCVAKGLIEMIHKGETGSIWVVEDEEPLYEVTVLTRQQRRK